MALVLKIIGAFSLALTAFPSVLVAMGSISLDRGKMLMSVGMVVWFISAPLVGRFEKRS